MCCFFGYPARWGGRKTIRKYIAPAAAVGIEPGSGSAKSEDEWHELVREWFPELSDARLRQVTGRRSPSITSTSPRN